MIVSMFVFGITSIEVWNTQFPVWAFVLALIICALPSPPKFRDLSEHVFSIRVYHPDRDDPSHYEPTDWPKASPPTLPPNALLFFDTSLTALSPNWSSVTPSPAAPSR